jgi:hypothetical protein
MSSGFCRRFVSFLQYYPDLLVRQLPRLIMSVGLRLQLAQPFRQRDGMQGPLSAADPDREQNIVAVNADALERLTRAVLPATSSTPVRECASGVRAFVTYVDDAPHVAFEM